jgi:hypothetical protein
MIIAKANPIAISAPVRTKPVIQNIKPNTSSIYKDHKVKPKFVAIKQISKAININIKFLRHNITPLKPKEKIIVGRANMKY